MEVLLSIIISAVMCTTLLCVGYIGVLLIADVVGFLIDCIFKVFRFRK